MKNILYISCHSILEYDECKLLTELGYNVRSVGAYTNPLGHDNDLRPSIPEMEYNEEHIRLAGLFGPENILEPALLEWADIIVYMHKPEWIWKNINALKQSNKFVVYRSIGQTTNAVEAMLGSFKTLLGDKFKIVRYSPNEISFPQFAGEDYLIRFYKDAEEFNDWNPDLTKPFVLLSCQSASTRGDFCHMQETLDATEGLSRLLLGEGNDDLAFRIPTMQASYEEMKKLFREASVFVYAGTLPACYTLSFLEAYMTGTPIISISEELWRHPHEGWVPEGLFAIPNLTQPFCIADSWKDLGAKTKVVLNSRTKQKTISNYNRTHALQYFSKEIVADQWERFLESL